QVPGQPRLGGTPPRSPTNARVKRRTEGERSAGTVGVPAGSTLVAGRPPEPGPAAAEVSTGHGDLSGTTARGAGVTLAAQVARILLQFVSVAVLARLLSPRDYGLLAVGLIVVGMGEVVRDLGLSAAALRATELTTRQRDGLFWLNSCAGLVL